MHKNIDSICSSDPEFCAVLKNILQRFLRAALWREETRHMNITCTCKYMKANNIIDGQKLFFSHTASKGKNKPSKTNSPRLQKN